MRIIEGSDSAPIIYTAHHASHNFGEFSDRVALTEEQRIRFSDYGTDITVPMNGLAAIVAERSRALGDLNRNPDDPGRFQAQDYAQPERHDIWLPGKELSEEDKAYCQKNFYELFHNSLIDCLAKRTEPTLVVAWDNTAHYEIGRNEAGETVIMKPVILSNRGKEGSPEASDEIASCDPELLALLADNLRGELAAARLPDEVCLNLVFKGGYICRTYSSRRNKELLAQHGVTADVQSLQIEYDTALTHDQETLEADPQRMAALTSAFTSAIEKSLAAL